MLVKAAPGLALRDPATMQRVPDEGVHVDDHSPLWNRMIADGDVVRVDEERAAPEHDIVRVGAAQGADGAPEHEPAPDADHHEPAPAQADEAHEPAGEPASDEEHA